MNLHRLLAICVATFAISASPPVFAEAKAPAPASSAQQAAPQVSKEKKPADVRYVVMLGSHDFDGLDVAEKTILDNYRHGRIDTDEFSKQITGLVSPPSSSYLPDARKWVEARPRSYAARLGLGILYLRAAWEARGTKWARETAREQFEQMGVMGQQALDSLRASLPLFEKPYPSYTAMIEVATLLSQREEQRGALNEAVKIDPSATSAYVEYIRLNTPRWGGSYKALESLFAEIKRGPMPALNQAYLDAILLSWKANDERSLNNNPAGAVPLYIEAYERFPYHRLVNLLYSAASAAKAANQQKTAIDIYTRIIAAYPDEAVAYSKRGDLYNTAESYDLALKDFIVASRLGDTFAQNAAGYYYMTGRGGSKDLKLAKTYFSQAAAKGDKHAEEKLKLLEGMK
ncbi:MAG: DUF4034 domain-containing protein [Azoarcus sp.]|jgi:tetratricopeptide (TPR) repeat protein|nr:DUF4034 domain-containing protein [Azoarcus sp.]